MRHRGSFTVEAALIMPVILGVIVMFIYAGMFLFDRCSFEYICQQASFSAAGEGGDIETKAEEYVRNELSKRLILDWDTDIRIYSDERVLITTIEAGNDLFAGSFIHTARTNRHFCPKY